MDEERQVRYNHRKSETNIGFNRWWFLIINQNREIKEIQQKIYNLFTPIVDEVPVPIEGVIKGTGLRYKVLDFESSKKVEAYRISEIYRRVLKDPKLYDRETKDGLANYLADHLES